MEHAHRRVLLSARPPRALWLLKAFLRVCWQPDLGTRPRVSRDSLNAFWDSPS